MKTFLFIDGTNLYAGQYQLFGSNKFLDFGPFIKEAEKKLKTKFDKIYFYASYSPKSKIQTKKEKLYLKNEALFYKSVKDTKNVIFFTGYRSKKSGKEKEVDVKLTADLVSFAFLDKYQTVYLFTGDADFLQALFSIRSNHNKKKSYILCLENKIMYKGAFYFKTYILNFMNKKMKFHQKQNVEILKFDSKNVIKMY